MPPLETPSVGAEGLTSLPTAAPAPAPAPAAQPSPAPAAPRQMQRPSQVMDRMLAGIDGDVFDRAQQEIDRANGLVTRDVSKPAARTPAAPPSRDPIDTTADPFQQQDNELARANEPEPEPATRLAADPELADIPPRYDENGQPVDMQAYAEGMIDAAKRALKTGEFPEEFLGLEIEYTVNGEPRRATVGELRGQAMLQATFTRRMQQVNAVDQQARMMLRARAAEVQAWRGDLSGRELRAGLLELGCEESLAALVHQMTVEKLAYLRMSPGERNLFDQRRMVEQENARLTAQLRQQQAQAAQLQAQVQGPDETTAHVAKQLEQLMPAAFRKVGQPQHPYAVSLFFENIRMFCPDGIVNAERCEHAALAVKQFIDDLDARRGQARSYGPAGEENAPAEQGQRPALRTYPMSPRRLAGSTGNAGTPRSNGKQPRGLRPSEAMARLQERLG